MGQGDDDGPRIDAGEQEALEAPAPRIEGAQGVERLRLYVRVAVASDGVTAEERARLVQHARELEVSEDDLQRLIDDETARLPPPPLPPIQPASPPATVTA